MFANVAKDKNRESSVTDGTDHPKGNCSMKRSYVMIVSIIIVLMLSAVVLTAIYFTTGNCVSVCMGTE